MAGSQLFAVPKLVSRVCILKKVGVCEMAAAGGKTKQEKAN